MKIQKQKINGCQICQKLFFEKKDVHITFDGNNEVYIERCGKDFYLTTKWLGCDNFHLHDYYGESSCNKNETKTKIKIYHCPYCGADYDTRISIMEELK